MKKFVDKYYEMILFLIYFLGTLLVHFTLINNVTYIICLFLISMYISFVEAYYDYNKLIFKKDKWKRFLLRLILFAVILIPVFEVSTLLIYGLSLLLCGILFMLCFNLLYNKFRGNELLYYGKESWFDDIAGRNPLYTLFIQFVSIIVLCSIIYKKF